jgi:hypothetical protein
LFQTHHSYPHLSLLRAFAAFAPYVFTLPPLREMLLTIGNRSQIIYHSRNSVLNEFDVEVNKQTQALISQSQISKKLLPMDRSDSTMILAISFSLM